MAFPKIHYLLAIAYFSMYGIQASTEDEGVHKDVEIEQRLKGLNKPAIKSIQLDYAIFDCVDIYKQPALDHPLLQNHKIQMKPSNWQDKSSPKVDTNHSTQPQILPAFDEYYLDCPSGTVPIRRTTKEDLIREKFSNNIFRYPAAETNDPIPHLAIMEIKQDSKYKITGAKGNPDIQNPKVHDGEASGALIWLFNGNSNANEVDDGIAAGWLVKPDFYGNLGTFFTALWKVKGGGGCLNVQCPGFVQVSKTTPLGFQITNISKYGGPLYSMHVWIHQDKETKNWWLNAGAKGTALGYWPKELFSTFDGGAKTLRYGGYADALPNQLSPPMGSGYSEKCQYSHTSFFGNLEYQTTDEILGGIYIYPRTYETVIPEWDCGNYAVSYMCKQVKELGYYFLFGGPRGKC